MKQPEEERRSMLFYESYEDAINDLYEVAEETQCLELYRAIVRYGLYGEEPTFTGIASTFWKLIYPTLKKQRDTAEAGRKGGKKGGKASKQNNPNGRRGKKGGKAAAEPEAPDGSAMDEEEATPKPQRKAAPARFAPPSVDEVQQYITAQGYAVNAANFVDFYASKGWRVGNNPMKDWKAAVRTWQRREQEHPTAPTSAAGSPAQFTPNERGEVNVCGIIVKLGYGERIDANGRRTYGNGRITVPQDAPRRPADDYEWSDHCNKWIYNCI